MSLIQWSDDFSVGVASIDGDHKELISIINEFHASMRQGEAKAIYGRTLEKLETYTKSHFRREEALMEKHGYPDIEEQKRQHDIFEKNIAKAIADFKSGQTPSTLKAMNFLSKWLTDHIQKVDLELGAFLQGKT